MKAVIDFYESYDEEKRITTDKARKTEFYVTITILNQHIKPHNRILELGAGTGVYSFYYAERGNHVVATDLSPKHVEIMKQKLKEKHSNINLCAEVVDAVDLSIYEGEAFDVVNCLGPMYHFKEKEHRIKCIQECIRVLKPGGLLAISYINKHYIIHGVLANQKEFFTKDFVDDIMNTGTHNDGGENCFFTVAYFTSPMEMESFLTEFHEVEIIDHVSTDGIGTLLRSDIDELSEEQYDAYLSYVIKNCKDKSTMGLSNHGLLICRKK
ncbi:class I SAM-dependent methyltransferase [Clostridium sp.]|uniref:class I SAM-dependent methyltransferase n=1 Tax=Clostridium sp. TaxID=1506 RepID=UPI002FC8C866